jgi:hypothetical protein
MNAHTPGPWRIDRRGSHNPLIETDGLTVAEVLDDCHPDAEQQEANARLIAAAPELLAACQAAIDAAVEYGGWHGDYTLASLLNMVIRKATTGEY